VRALRPHPTDPVVATVDDWTRPVNRGCYDASVHQLGARQLGQLEKPAGDLAVDLAGDDDDGPGLGLLT
jgi:hypothetical protein